jgi:hypothetical protein
MTNLTINVKLDLQVFAIFFLAVASLFFIFSSKEVRAVSTTSLSGTYGCLQNKNFGGFVSAKTGGTQSINNILLITFTSGSNTVSIKGVANQVTNFERANPGTVTTLFDTPATATYSATTITNLFKVTDPTDPVNGDSYIAVVNSGNTLLFMGAPTTTSTDNAICQLM